MDKLSARLLAMSRDARHSADTRDELANMAADAIRLEGGFERATYRLEQIAKLADQLALTGPINGVVSIRRPA